MESRSVLVVRYLTVDNQSVAMRRRWNPGRVQVSPSGKIQDSQDPQYQSMIIPWVHKGRRVDSTVVTKLPVVTKGVRVNAGGL